MLPHLSSEAEHVPFRVLSQAWGKWVSGGRMWNFPSPIPTPRPNVPGLLTQIEFGNLGFFHSVCSLLLHFSSTGHLPASGPLHLLFSLPGSWRDFLCSSVSSSKRHPPLLLLKIGSLPRPDTLYHVWELE